MIHELDIFQNFTAASPRERGSMLRLKMQLTEQRVFVVKNYFETKSFEIVQQRFEENFPERSSTYKKDHMEKLSGSSIMKEQQFI